MNRHIAMGFILLSILYDRHANGDVSPTAFQEAALQVEEVTAGETDEQVIARLSK